MPKNYFNSQQTMKKFENKVTTLRGEGDKKLTYKDIIILCLNHPPAEGFTRSVNKERNRIEDNLEPKKGFIEMEDNDITVLKAVVESMVWAARNKELEQFQDHIEAIG